MRVLTLLIAAACFSCLTPPPDGEKKEIDVYILAGQSNMEGTGELSELPEEWLQPIPGVTFMGNQNRRFETLRPGVTHTSYRKGHFGPELGFAKGLRLLSPSRPVWIIKYEFGGHGLHAGWDSGKWKGPDPGPGRSSFYPGKSAGDPHQGARYREWMELVSDGLRELRSAGLVPVIRGVAWVQGERDASRSLSASTYGSNLKHLRERLIQDLKCAEDLPWVYAQVLPWPVPPASLEHAGEIRARMAEVDARSGDPEAHPCMWMVRTEGMGMRPDHVHFNTQGQQHLGISLATSLIQLRNRLLWKD